MSPDVGAVVFLGHISRAADRLEEVGHGRGRVADFLLRCSFSMFATSFGFLPPRAVDWAIALNQLDVMWTAMGHVLWGKVPERGIFADPFALPLDDVSREALKAAAACDCNNVELSIFGSLVERSLDAKTRHSLGAHYTPRSYVERLVRPTIEEPMRDEWELLRGLSRLSTDLVIPPHHSPEESLRWVLEFHTKLCTTRVLDPACGSGNFLYVAMSILQDLEEEVVAEIERRGAPRPDARITPGQFLGIEINPRAAGIADLVLQLGYLKRLRQQ